jgi:hypothetical protein
MQVVKLEAPAVAPVKAASPAPAAAAPALANGAAVAKVEASTDSLRIYATPAGVVVPKVEPKNEDGLAGARAPIKLQATTYATKVRAPLTYLAACLHDEAVGLVSVWRPSPSRTGPVHQVVVRGIGWQAYVNTWTRSA